MMQAQTHRRRATAGQNIEVVGVSKAFVSFGRRHTVFADLNLTFPRGVNTAVIGPNGAGKTTLLRLLAGAEAPDRGYVDRHTRLSWPLGFSGCFSPHLSGVANARFAARIYEHDPDYVVAFTKEFSGIGAFMDWPMKGYSTGMRARYSFALSMAIDFDCILIDEILGVGDADFKAKCAAALDERRARSDLILVTHNLKDVIRLCDRVIVIGGPKPIISDDVVGTVKRYSLALTGSAEGELV
jgi:capsular polysaccharide transport system ATP-binding protein